jgi:hypothetical protein
MMGQMKRSSLEQAALDSDKKVNGLLFVSSSFDENQARSSLLCLNMHG